jgi:glucose/arabinose dehydrogenase
MRRMTTRPWHFTKAALLAATCFAAISCGGGGGGDGDSPDDPNELPRAVLRAPANLAQGLQGTLTLTATADDDGGVALVEFEIDGQLVGTDATAPYAVEVDTDDYVAGQHVVRVRSRDAEGEASAWDSARVTFDSDADVNDGFSLDEAWVEGLTGATAFAQAPDGRFFVAQQGGALRVIKDGQLLPTPFLQVAVAPGRERGLIGVALHPQFDTNGWVYVHYTTPENGAHNRVSRFTANGDVASAGSEVMILDLPALSSAPNHNGGALHFGADGKLYIGVGENAQPALAQDLSHPFGKLLRLNDDGTIPDDNPFYEEPDDLASAVWAYGLRNPFTFAIHPQDGRIHINDVGANTWEEINLGQAGANYGWPDSEGPDDIVSGLTAPRFAYGHDDQPDGSGPGGFLFGESIAGGAFHPGEGGLSPDFEASYFFADFVNRFVGRLDMANGDAAYSFANLDGNPVDLRFGTDGALYVLTRTGIARIDAD